MPPPQPGTCSPSQQHVLASSDLRPTLQAEIGVGANPEVCAVHVRMSLAKGVAQMPGVARQENRGAVMIVSQGAEIVVDEAFQFERTVGLDPARGR